MTTPAQPSPPPNDQVGTAPMDQEQTPTAIAPDPSPITPQDADNRSLGAALPQLQSQTTPGDSEPILLNLPDAATQRTAISLLIVMATLILGTGLLLQIAWIALPAAGFALLVSLIVLWEPISAKLQTWMSNRDQQGLLAGVLGIVAISTLIHFSGLSPLRWFKGPINWDAFGALAEAFGALGQILVAFLALFVAWRQYVISKELTTQQNRITQQQTIDTYFQGISDLILNEEGLLEDWPPERAIAEGRTAAILSGLNAEGKAKILRFLSSAKLLTPLKRDRRLGRPIFDGLGGYEEDVEYGVRVVDLVNMLAYADLAGTDLRRTDLSEANLVSTNLRGCDLSRANLSRTILFGANLTETNLTRVRFFYGSVETATPRDRLNPPNYQTGAQTGAVIENADFSQVEGLSPEQHYYCCAWGGTQTRATIPGGCDQIPNQLGR